MAHLFVSTVFQNFDVLNSPLLMAEKVLSPSRFSGLLKIPLIVTLLLLLFIPTRRISAHRKNVRKI